MSFHEYLSFPRLGEHSVMVDFDDLVATILVELGRFSWQSPVGPSDKSHDHPHGTASAGASLEASRACRPTPIP